MYSPIPPAPLFERRRYNTLEKLLHNSQKDEGLLIQMMALSSNLHCDHNQLNTVLQDMLDQLRSGMSNRQQEMETLPHDSARLDLISHDRSINYTCILSCTICIIYYVHAMSHDIIYIIIIIN